MNTRLNSAIALGLALVMITAAATTAAAADGSIMNGTNGFEYHTEGIVGWDEQMSGLSDLIRYGSGSIDSQVVTVSGTLNLETPSQHRCNYAALVTISTNEYDVNGNTMGHPDYVCDGPAWRWDNSYDQLESSQGITREVPFSVSFPVPGYDEANEITEVFFVIDLDCELYHPMYTTGWPASDRTKFSCQLKGSVGIPEDMKAKPVVVLTTTNGGKLDPLRVKFRLMDNSTTPSKPLKNTVISVQAPIPSRPANLIKDFFSVADWSLSGYFMSKTKCANCEWKQAGSQYTSEIYYYLKNPGEPIEVLTDANGNAELLFFLDLPALARQKKTPSREQPLRIPIQAEYIATEGEQRGEVLAESSLNVSLDHIGYVTAVTYVQPQEWEAVGGLGDYRRAGYNPGEYDLAGYQTDKGTGLPYDDVRGSDRARIAIQVTSAGGIDGYGVAGGTPKLGTIQNSPGEPLRPGMLFAPGDRIDLDARGLLRYKPADPQSPESQMYAKPGWVWVQIKFFDGLKAKVGVSGICGKHSLTFGRTPVASGWVPTGKAFIYWAGQEAAEQAVTKLIPVYGQIDLVSDMAGYISWANNGEPVYIRVESDLVVNRENDGGAIVTVSGGQPAVVSQGTGFDGVKAVAGESAVISTTNQVSVAASSAEQKAYADGLLAGLNSGFTDPAGLKPIELEASSASAQNSGGYADEAGDVPMHEDEAGDVPLGLNSYYSFDEFSMGIWDNWTYSPESDESFASFSHDEIPLYIVIARVEASSAEMLTLLEMKGGSPEDLELGGRDALIYPLLENGSEFGMMLSFSEPLANGNRLHVLFFSDTSVWADMTDMVIELLLGMSFSR